MEVFIVYKRGYREDLYGYPQGLGIETIEGIISVRATEDAAKEEIISSTRKDLNYIRKTVR
jgi:hypothetical protein